MIKRMAVAIALTFAPAAFAQTYIVPEGDCGAVTLHATRGTDFPNLGDTIGVDRVKDAHVYLPNQKVAVKPAAGPRSLDFSTNVPDDGLVIAAVDFEPTVTGNETRTEHAKAFIRCGGIARGGWRRTTGLGVEIYPQWNEGIALKPGHSMRFIAVDEATNKVIRDVPMELYRVGAGHVGSGVPDQYGGMNFPDKEPGRYMVMTTYRRPDPEQPEHWLVDTSTLTFEIK